jgi:hypothetical protein
MPITTGHEEELVGLHFPGTRAEAVFAPEGLRLANEDPASLLLDEHGGTYVLRVGDLTVLEAGESGADSGIRLQVPLPPPETLVTRVETFAGQHRLALAPGPPASELEMLPILAACHVPGKNLFIYCEEAQLQVRPGPGPSLKITVTGAFRSRRLPCREPDVVIHLGRWEIPRLLSYLLSLARAEI